ncbi:hypothetical protein D3C71_1126150 [compost metagenome]
MVFYVSVKSALSIKFFSFKFGENILRSFLENICQCIQATTVSHPHYEVFYT